MTKARQAHWPFPYGSRLTSYEQVPPGSVPVTAIILAQDERMNIERAIRSVGWCAQTVVVDSGSADGTPALARAAGATVWQHAWCGFAAQREWAMRHPDVAHDWVFFLDADEWASEELAREVSVRLGTEECAAYAMRWRLVFLRRWIAHCGWYANSWQARLLDRRSASFLDSDDYGERASVNGRVLRLAADFVDEDAKGLAHWLVKHVRYAELEARRRRTRSTSRPALATLARRSGSTRPLARTMAKEILFPVVPAKPFALFCYMYVVRSGWRDGRAGLLFCLFHAWYELTVETMASIDDSDRGRNAEAVVPRPSGGGAPLREPSRT